MDQLFVLLGTLCGAVVGAAGTWIVQRDVYRQQARDRRRDTERAVILQWLVASHKLFQVERAAQRQLSKDGDKVSYAAALDAARSGEALAALEELSRAARGRGWLASARNRWGGQMCRYKLGGYFL
jgi:hypothetical protein